MIYCPRRESNNPQALTTVCSYTNSITHALFTWLTTTAAQSSRFKQFILEKNMFSLKSNKNNIQRQNFLLNRISVQLLHQNTHCKHVTFLSITTMKTCCLHELCQSAWICSRLLVIKQYPHDSVVSDAQCRYDCWISPAVTPDLCDAHY